MTVAETIKLTRAVPFGLIEFEERPPDPKTGRSYRAYNVTVNGERKRYPSVTTILGVLDKPALNRWKEKVAAAGAVELARTGAIDDLVLEDLDAVQAAMESHKADSQARSMVAAQRGVDIHGVLEKYARTGEAPNPADYPPEHRGYIRGLVRWLLDDDPQPEAVEQLVAHPGQRYAGRYDLRAFIKGHGSCIIDLKTNAAGRVYREAHVQTVGYALADEACGAPPVDDIILVGVGENGGFERVRGQAGPADWKAILDVRNRMTRLDIGLRDSRKAVAA